MSGKSRIDPTAFILNSLRFEKRVNTLRFQLKYNSDGIFKNVGKPHSLEEICNSKYLNIETLKENLKHLRGELIDENFFPSFLLKHTDMTYNVIKRVIRQMLYTSDSVVTTKKYKPSVKPTDKDPDNPAYIIHDFYERLYKELENQDKVYYTTEKAEGQGFAKIFARNPVVKLFYDKLGTDGTPKGENEDDRGELVRLLQNDNPWIHLEKYSKSGSKDAQSSSVCDKKVIHTIEVLDPISVKISDPIEVTKPQNDKLTKLASTAQSQQLKKETSSTGDKKGRKPRNGKK